MKKLKEFYLSPEAELLVVRFEENFCGTGTPGAPGGDDEYDDQGNF